MNEKTKGVRTILFDMDGTLVDTEPAAAQAIREAFLDWNIQIAKADSHYVTGRTWAVAFDYLFKKYKIPVSREEASTKITSLYRERLETDLAIVPGSVDAVRSLVGHFQLALVSGSHRSEIIWAMKKVGLLDCFEVILGAEDYPKSKPAPDGYLKAMKLFKAEATSTMVFEDSEAGIASARAAGLFVVAITSTNHFGHDTKSANLHISDLTTVDRQWVLDLGELALVKKSGTLE